VNVQEFTTGMEAIAGRLLKAPPSSKQIDALFPKVSGFDAKIFADAVESLSMGEYMPRLKELYEAYYIAKSKARAGNPDWQGCKFCERGKVFYERKNPASRLGLWHSYIGYCGHCNPPINKSGKFKIYSGQKYKDIRFPDMHAQADENPSPQEVKRAVKAYTGEADPEKERDRKRNIEKYETEDFPF